MALILDLIIVAIFVVSIIITAKRGFVKSVSLILGFFLDRRGCHIGLASFLSLFSGRI